MNYYEVHMVKSHYDTIKDTCIHKQVKSKVDGMVRIITKDINHIHIYYHLSPPEPYLIRRLPLKTGKILIANTLRYDSKYKLTTRPYMALKEHYEQYLQQKIMDSL